jgi:hypothetical protein
MKNEEMEFIKAARPSSSSQNTKEVNCTKAIRVSRRGNQDGK